ncbi:MAG: type II toxin-antitoxin system HicB family antitoxin [Planctomycetia bacterium]|nr:type II toxin-antitoxin system HicB family antitoxin [Planctomycetia bacterium]
MKVTYPAIFEKGKEDIWVRFPDVDRGVTAGDTLEEARQNAAELLAEMLEDYSSEGENFPIPGQVYEELSETEFIENISIEIRSFSDGRKRTTAQKAGR